MQEVVAVVVAVAVAVAVAGAIPLVAAVRLLRGLRGLCGEIRGRRSGDDVGRPCPRHRYPSRIPPRLRSAPATFSAKALRSSLGRAR